MNETKPNAADSVEVEWQFDAIDLERVESWLRRQPASAALAFTHAKDVIQRDSYLDTADWSVHRAGFSLRIRRKDAGNEATLKSLETRSKGPQKRREINQSMAADQDDSRHGDGPVSERVRMLAGDRPLAMLFEVETRRRTYLAQEQGRTVAEIALDDTRISKHEQTVSEIKRVEIECVGEAAVSPLLQSFIDALAAATGLTPSQASKFETGLAAAGLEPESWTDFGHGTLSADADGAEYALAILRRFWRELVKHEPGTRLGEDPEELHDMRVSLRRLRAALSMFRDVLEPDFEGLKDDLRWLGQNLGEVRDLDVQLQDFAEMRAQASWDEGIAIGELMRVLDTSRSEARVRLLQALESERYTTLIGRLKQLLAEDREHPLAGVAIRELATPILRKRYRRFERDAQELTPESEPTAYHAVRVRAKRLRYSVEFVRLLYGRPAERFAEAVVEVQDLLGEHQDAHVIIDWLQDLVRQRGSTLAPTTLLFMGEMLATKRRTMGDLRAEWPEAFDELGKRGRRLRRELDQQTQIETLLEPDDVLEPPSAGARVATRRWPVGPFALLRRRRQTSISGE